MISFRVSPLLDMALSLLVLQNPERFGNPEWAPRVTERAPARALEDLLSLGERVDLFQLALELESGPSLPAPDRLRRLHESEPTVVGPLLAYWEAISPEVGARAALLAESIQREASRLAQLDPLVFISRFSDRVTVDGDAILLHWGKGMRVRLAELDQILFVPSAFCPRRLMFYRVGSVQIFFYDPTDREPAEVEEAPESLVLGFGALADANRLKLLRLVARDSLPAQEMARRLGLNESTVSRHLRLLVEAGLVGRERQEGKFIYYSLQAERIDQLALGARAYIGRERA